MIDTVLETKGLTKYYGDRLAVEHMNLQIPRGCICGFIGRNGAGKTTAIKLMLGLLRPTSGNSMILGCDSQDLTPAIRQRVGYVTEGHRLIQWMKISELEKFQRSFFPKQWDRKFFTEMIEYFELSNSQKIKTLSNGQRAQVSLALALAPNPELLIMDDPTLGLDAAIRRQFLEGMIELIMRQGRTILFSSHILGDVERVTDRVVVIDKGVVRADCKLEEFQQAVAKVIVSFEGSVPTDVDIEGLLHFRAVENTLELVVIGTSKQRISEWAESAGANGYEIVKMNLEDQFIEFTASANHRKIFKWEKK